MGKQKDTKRWLLLNRKTVGQGGGNRDAKALPDLKPLKLFLSLEQLPLSVYITCAVDKDYSGLVIAGKPTAKELQEAWIKLQSDFYELIEDKRVQDNNDLTGKINKISLKIDVVTCLIAALLEEYKE